MTFVFEVEGGPSTLVGKAPSFQVSVRGRSRFFRSDVISMWVDSLMTVIVPVRQRTLQGGRLLVYLHA